MEVSIESTSSCTVPFPSSPPSSKLGVNAESLLDIPSRLLCWWHWLALFALLFCPLLIPCAPLPGRAYRNYNERVCPLPLVNYVHQQQQHLFHWSHPAQMQSPMLMPYYGILPVVMNQHMPSLQFGKNILVD